MRRVVLKHCKSELHSFCQPDAWSPPGKSSREECETSKGTTQPQTPGIFSVYRTSVVSLRYFQHLCCAKDKSDHWPTNAQLFIINISQTFWLSKSAHMNFGCKVLTQWYYSYKTWKSNFYMLLGNFSLLHPENLLEKDHFLSHLFSESSCCHFSYWFCTAKKAQREVDQSLSYLVYYDTWLPNSRQRNKNHSDGTKQMSGSLFKWCKWHK